jgi:hypothetical protein
MSRGRASIQGDASLASGTVTMRGVNTAQAVKPADYSAANWSGSISRSFGAGVFVEDYGTHGAYVIGPSGGHNHSPTIGALVFPLDDFTWTYLSPDGVSVKDQTGAASDYTTAELTADPYRELTGTQVPCPDHPYHHHSVWPGGVKGRLTTITRAAITPGADNVTSSHSYDLNTRVWSRMTTAQFDSARVQTESSIVYRPSPERWYLVSQAYHNFQSLQYLRASDMTVVTTESQSGFPPTAGAGGSYDVSMYCPMHDIILMQRRDGTFMGYDPTDATSEQAGWKVLTHTGTCPTSNERWCWVDSKNAFYKIVSTGGSTMLKLTPPADWENGTWALTQITLSQSVAAFGDAAVGGTLAYGSLIYSPSKDRLYWFPLGPSATGMTLQVAEIVP